MTEPENFEDDLFADLYDDNDAPKPVPARVATAPPAPEVQPPTNTHNDDDHNGTYQHQVAGGDEHMTQDQDEDEDDVDFNLGGGGYTGSGHTGQVGMHDDASTPPYGTVHKASAKEDGKMFIGGLNWETTDQSLRDYFSQFGEVVECTVMRDSSTGRSRGFGFLTFKDAKTVNIVMVKEHFLDGKIIDPKRAIPRDEQEKTSKIFVGGVSQETTDQEFKEYFAQFGRVVDATLMMDKDTGRPRGFGFVTFENEAGVDACINVPLEIHGKPIEVKKAQPRGNLREEEEASRRGKFRKDGDQSSQSSMGQQMGNNGMTPQVMAQYFQRMQQYFAMMQSQMAMTRGMPMNPAMWQNMMQMQQMQQQMMGRGGGGANAQNMMQNMNPQMMQQMQQMQQQMMQQQGQQGGQDAASGSASPTASASGGGGRGYDNNNYNQYQQTQGGRRGGRGGYGGHGGHGGYGMGGGGGGAPTSWEGMYDDVPQPNSNQGSGGFNRAGSTSGNSDPQHAPPANAPTGPKNAGKPGANYRGGGRGGNRGYHPYSR
ncbi:putative heterogeneous nuclear ribonucleoprotein HRP1 [Fusarium austroafricanum]|uniref:Putative heterogeneous nuclear ribonucleoprotein HRP1 n=1 Tax=Fusarium austroafricanum TaxID=2364996 RepID=A0A8H4KFP6_9HYPO|nr:putative heterogeneous nuclear ribonucleoprotein HRP1 [Fusarium austroafricanum]